MTSSERLLKLIETEQMTAKQFSEEVGIQPGTISNILKGRNNPSLDLMQKVLVRFRTVSSDWLILGIGSMYRQKNDSQALTLFDVRPETDSLSDGSVPAELQNSPFGEQPKQKTATPQAVSMPQRNVKKIVIFYDDGTFEEIENNL